ncbi:photosynthetic reaction center subunit H [Rhodoplanes sp. TEM]|uniref:Photosynthetic reaction center subunit H n=1 Tax=Rhodoplanes tepidamans TaxID=200616 RepID=A0ABT5J4N1_RHOTP|nr:MULTISPECIES: photosynthetic reaction center subunit H [Rhodoplanes]MDC7784587.1 photosynthetic reaction center subunit H [Rhodoplanes tepidamans]MDC7982879.1 photosynthetic reaction center subunit H [Rhodoplanes sp. TEM]MDQ0355815.1 photosynthetic reaction center H subunit [Rhodoplanes tepidamans]
MQTGAFTGYMDVAQVVLYAFWIFFAGLIFYLRREDKREGYPLDSDRTVASGGQVEVVGWPRPPEPKTYLLASGATVTVPSYAPLVIDTRVRPGPHAGSPFEPVGDPMKTGVGPAAYADRADHPDLTWEGENRIVPLRVATDHWVEENDPDPRGMTVIAADGEAAGVVTELWIDRAEPIVRYYEVALGGKGGKTVMLPAVFAYVHADRKELSVPAVLASQFAGVPSIKSPNQITALEEDKISAYFAGGKLYATPERAEPLL